MAVTSMLAVNIGNTVTKIGLYQHDTLVSKWTVTTPATITVSEVQTILMNFFASLQREQKRGQHLKKNQHQDGSENQSFISENTKTSDVSAAEADFEQLNIQGGIIAPGLESSAKGLSAAAAKLPVVDLKAPTTVIGKSTRAAMQSGVVLGEVARIDGLVSYIWQELGYKTKVIAAGADAKLIKVLSQTVTDTVDNLTLHGLKVLFDRNTK